eukprot:COSAG01_NODE_48_length_31904_cov_21.696997_18_plen_148_part_00
MCAVGWLWLWLWLWLWRSARPAPPLRLHSQYAERASRCSASKSRKRFQHTRGRRLAAAATVPTPRDIDAPCTQCIRHGDPIHASNGRTLGEPPHRGGTVTTTTTATVAAVTVTAGGWWQCAGVAVHLVHHHLLGWLAGPRRRLLHRA